MRVLIVGIGVIFTVGSYATSLGSKGYERIQSAEWWPSKGEYGYYYPVERWGEKKMVWTMQRSSRRHFIKKDIVGFEIFAHPKNCRGPEGLKVTIGFDDTIIDELHFFMGGSRYLQYYLPDLAKQTVLLQMETNRTFQPYRSGLGNDKRKLAVALGRFHNHAKLPESGIGFYSWEQTKGIESDNIDTSQTVSFRWTGMNAAQPIGKNPSLWDKFYIRCGHPDVGQNPVMVKISGDFGVLVKEKLNNNDWVEIKIESFKYNMLKKLAFSVDRIWNPYLAGGSKDSRDLGIAVANLNFGPAHISDSNKP